MLTSSFDRAFRRLVVAFKRHQDVWRSPDNVAEIGSARWELELARNAAAIERERVIRPLPPAPSPLRKMAVSEADLARLQVEAISVGFG